MVKSTWLPYTTSSHGRLTTVIKNSLPIFAFAFPNARKEPMKDATNVRDAMARFNQVKGVTNAERDLAFINIQKAAHDFNIHMNEKSWHEFGLKYV